MNTLNLLVLRCADIDKSRAFYECFGMNFTKHAHGTGPEHFACEDGGKVFELYPAKAIMPDETTALGFNVADLERMRDRLNGQGYRPGTIKDTPWGRTFVVRDPDGRRVELNSG